MTSKQVLRPHFSCLLRLFRDKMGIEPNGKFLGKESQRAQKPAKHRKYKRGLTMLVNLPHVVEPLLGQEVPSGDVFTERGLGAEQLETSGVRRHLHRHRLYVENPRVCNQGNHVLMTSFMQVNHKHWCVCNHGNKILMASRR